MNVKTMNGVRNLLVVCVGIVLAASLLTTARHGFQLVGLFVEKQIAQQSTNQEPHGHPSSRVGYWATQFPTH